MIVKKCDECGREFNAKTSKQRFCPGPHKQICAICGKEFEYTCIPNDKPQTCSKECKAIYRKKCLQDKYGVENVSQIPEVREKKKISNASEESQAKMRATCLERYGVERANQSPEVQAKISAALKSEKTREKVKATFQAHYGVDHVFQLPAYRKKYGADVVSKLESTKQSVRRSVFERYGVTSVSHIPGVSEKAQTTREAKCIENYGVDCIFKSDAFKAEMQSRFGVDNVMKNPDILRKAFRNKQRKSSLETRLHNFLNAYNIHYIEEFPIKSGEMIHSFDVYLPKYKILIDCDGEYWHSYISDPDGDRVRDDGDEVRIALVPHDHIFHLIVESDFERGLRELQKLISKIDSGLLNYDTDLFKWCRSIGFPYYEYDDKRLHYEWNRLCGHIVQTYNPNCRFGNSIINHFHKSIYDAKTKGELSPREAWDNDELLKKVIANRLIYQNTVNPSKILQGFNISKIAPKVSVFNPVLALYICQKYLNRYQTVFDPFSGFSGRLLGCCAAGKQYIGQDINEAHVTESNQIISYFDMSKIASVTQQDIFTSNAVSSDALLTCPPYDDIEVYGNETEFRSCDDWIDFCISKFDCKRYIFVINTTERYKDNVVEELPCKSHFRHNAELIVMIDKS